jgi:hypothetical protein
VRLSHRTDAAQQRLRGFEASQLAAMGEKLRNQIARWTRPAILGMVIGWAGMNAFAANTTTVVPRSRQFPRRRQAQRRARRWPDAHHVIGALK